jgi:hypothetical protein
MLTRAAREEKAQLWLERLGAWQAQGDGVSLAHFARTQGWKGFDAYRWARTLRREGRWDEPSPRMSKRRPKPGSRAAQFVRVRLAATAASVAPRMSLTLRVRLANGRSGELDLEGTEQLLQVIAALEQAA